MRSPEEVRSELDHLRSDAEAAGKKPSGVKIGALRNELIETQAAEIEALRARLAEDGPAPTASIAASDEWTFIEKTLAEVQLRPGADQSRAAKNAYNGVVYKLNLWRTMRDVYGEIGVGGDCPPWNDLNRDDATGVVVPPKPVVEKAPPSPGRVEIPPAAEESPEMAAMLESARLTASGT